MEKLAKNILELVGNTPLLELSRFSKMKGLATPLVAKLEYFNPAGSVKDRVALSLVEDAERRGVLTQGGTIIEPTSGNTGIGLAMVAAVKGYHLILTMPETMSVERRKLLKAYGAEIVLTPGVEGMSGAIAEAERLKNAMSGAVILQQFENPANVEAHCRTTAQEIWNDTGGKIICCLCRNRWYDYRNRPCFEGKKSVSKDCSCRACIIASIVWWKAGCS